MVTDREYFELRLAFMANSAPKTKPPEGGLAGKAIGI
jgi:hypothetical protein